MGERNRGKALRTTNDGKTWESCRIPPGAEALDFRAVQAFDANTAIVMSAGTGDLSRLYKTTDGCKSWKLVLTNPDGPNNGFYDALLFISPKLGLVFGDPAHGGTRNPVEGSYFTLRIGVTHDGGETWIPIVAFGKPGEALTPLSNEGSSRPATLRRLYAMGLFGWLQAAACSLLKFLNC